MSDTPRTREETRWYETGIVHACFAAQLERELNAANERIAELKQELNESNETIRLQHKLITTAEKRCFDKYKEELTASNERIKRLKSFISEVARPWECTCRFTVWNLYNKKTAECDCCRAEGLLKEAKP